jgi:hypothetical protein
VENTVENRREERVIAAERPSDGTFDVTMPLRARKIGPGVSMA